MIRKFVAIATLALIGLFFAPSAQAFYAPPDEPDLVLLLDPDDIIIGQTQVPFDLRDFLPGSEARFAVSADGVSSSDIDLEVLQSGDGAGATATGSISTMVGSDGTFRVGAVLPAEATYLIAASGLDIDGNPTTVSMTLTLGAGGGSTGGGGELPGTGFSSFSALLAGVGLAGLGAGVIVLSRRRSQERTTIDA